MGTVKCSHCGADANVLHGIKLAHKDPLLERNCATAGDVVSSKELATQR